MADLSPYYKENEEISSLRSNSNQAGEDDADHPSKTLKTIPNEPEPSKRSKEAKEVHALVKNYLKEPNSELANSSKN